MVLCAVLLFFTARTRNVKTNPYTQSWTYWMTTRCSFHFPQLVPLSINFWYTVKARRWAMQWGCWTRTRPHDIQENLPKPRRSFPGPLNSYFRAPARALVRQPSVWCSPPPGRAKSSFHHSGHRAHMGRQAAGLLKRPTDHNRKDGAPTESKSTGPS